MISVRMWLAYLILLTGLAGNSWADEQGSNANEVEAIEWLRDQVEFVACDKSHFIYGVGYIDGSYMERIFLVADERGKPLVEVEFRKTEETWPQSSGDLEPRSFIIEVDVPRALYAQKSNSGWQVGNEGWETALRFKYTSWFGLLSRIDNQWQAEWQGYRRPMLPAELRTDGTTVCGWFNTDQP